MKFIAKTALVLVLAASGVVIDGALKNDGTVIGAYDGRAHAQAVQPKPTSQPANSAVTYAYIAQHGDAYTYIARKAVQTYGKKANVKLTPAQIIYAETNLTLQAGSPILTTDQKVTVSEANIKQWVDKAKTLSADEQTAWQYYVQFVDFNTDHVGVAH